jgi:hypothetical protein
MIPQKLHIPPTCKFLQAIPVNRTLFIPDLFPYNAGKWTDIFINRNVKFGPPCLYIYDEIRGFPETAAIV